MLETESRVDILINCAGVKETPQWLTQVEEWSGLTLERTHCSMFIALN